MKPIVRDLLEAYRAGGDIARAKAVFHERLPPRVAQAVLSRIRQQAAGERLHGSARALLPQLGPRLASRLRREAKRCGTAVDGLLVALLAAVAEDRLFTAVLDDD